jgi:hypothetical protein
MSKYQYITGRNSLHIYIKEGENMMNDGFWQVALLLSVVFFFYLVMELGGAIISEVVYLQQ